MDTMDDAGVYRLTPDLALVQTVDFLFPVVNDARSFGRIAAANSLSDVWAMGAKALTAMNVLAYPAGKIPPEVIGEMLTGASEKLKEAQVALVGGHTMEQDYLLYGMSVTGTVHPDRVLTNGRPRVGDVLILTKALGTGVYANALRANGLTEAQYGHFVESMERLNRYAAESAIAFDISAMTDVTGFGLLGHAFQVARNGGVTFQIDTAHVPRFPDLFALMAAHHAYQVCKCKELVMPHTLVDPDVSEAAVAMAGDAQTSGGLLIAVAEKEAEACLAAIRAGGDAAEIIGKVCAPEPMPDCQPCYLHLR